MESTVEYNSESPEVKARSKRMLLYIGIFSIVMLFGGLTSAYIVSQADGFWVDIKMPIGFYISTALLLASSGTMWLAKKQVKGGQNPFGMIALTLALGIAFSVFQFQSWKQLTETGNYFIGNFTDLKGEHGDDYTFIYKGLALEEVDGEFYEQSDKLRENPLTDRVLGSRNTASSYIYVLSAVHLIHLLGGLIYLLVVMIQAKKGQFGPSNYLRVELCGTYWHFLDGLWVYLFLFLLFIH
ncbi:MAG: cytochrome c oxidase subunit 3 [Luteibaculum sp.]